MKVLVVGVGNVLRGDDGFGVAVVERLLQDNVPDDVKVFEIGIGGIHLVQELLDPVDVLLIIDAVDAGKAPGSVMVMKPDVADVSSMSLMERHDRLADMHYAVPERALMLARGLGVLPAAVFIVGGQKEDTERYEEGLSSSLRRAVGIAAGEVKTIVTELGVRWD